MTVIETERLLLRPMTFADTDDLAALYADPEVMRFFDGTRTREQAVEQIRKCQELYRSVGFYFWATIHKADDRFIGRCGLLPQVIDGRPEYEVAYMIARSYWGQGLGTEAARGIRDWAFASHPFPRLVSIIAPDNLASRRVAEKNGMRYLGDIEFEGYLDCLYAIDRKE
jgi:ribosomal-protein-alanine N-acetyltransferase